jgi:hypothetical protein
VHLTSVSVRLREKPFVRRLQRRAAPRRKRLRPDVKKQERRAKAVYFAVKARTKLVSAVVSSLEFTRVEDKNVAATREELLHVANAIVDAGN